MIQKTSDCIMLKVKMPEKLYFNIVLTAHLKKKEFSEQAHSCVPYIYTLWQSPGFNSLERKRKPHLCFYLY